LALFAGYELVAFKQVVGNHQDAVRICQKFNQKYIIPHFASHAVLTVFLLLTGTWKSFFLNLPLLLYRGYLYKVKQHVYYPENLAGSKVHKGYSGFLLSNDMRQALTLLIYFLAEVIYVSNLLGA